MIDSSVTRTDGDQFDEYLWPLTDLAWPVDWRRMANEHRLRQRLGEILTHVQNAHVAPRVRRLGVSNPSAVAEITQRIISGPLTGEFWERMLHDPVPRTLREEWAALSSELKDLGRDQVPPLRARLK